MGQARSLALLALWITTGIVPDIRVALGLGAILVLFAGWSLRKTLRSPLVGGPMRRWVIVLHGLMILGPCARLGGYLLLNYFAVR